MATFTSAHACICAAMLPRISALSPTAISEVASPYSWCALCASKLKRRRLRMLMLGALTIRHLSCTRRPRIH
ncbi:hypothetical protein BC835DRAFT_1319175 [Cytidiella melzeri]|nr:hypothetical protein BC835DRAFT_1319175 [Cytidiella melzeri]